MAGQGHSRGGQWCLVLHKLLSTPLHILHLLLLLVLVLQRLQPLLVQLAAQQAAGDAAQELLVGGGGQGRGVRKVRSGLSIWGVTHWRSTENSGVLQVLLSSNPLR